MGDEVVFFADDDGLERFGKTDLELLKKVRRDRLPLAERFVIQALDADHAHSPGGFLVWFGPGDHQLEAQHGLIADRHEGALKTRTWPGKPPDSGKLILIRFYPEHTAAKHLLGPAIRVHRLPAAGAERVH